MRRHTLLVQFEFESWLNALDFPMLPRHLLMHITNEELWVADIGGRECIWMKLKILGVPKTKNSVIRSRYMNFRSRALHDGKLSNPFDTLTGVRQVCLLEASNGEQPERNHVRNCQTKSEVGIGRLRK